MKLYIVASRWTIIDVGEDLSMTLLHILISPLRRPEKTQTYIKQHVNVGGGEPWPVANFSQNLTKFTCTEFLPIFFNRHDLRLRRTSSCYSNTFRVVAFTAR